MEMEVVSLTYPPPLPYSTSLSCGSLTSFRGQLEYLVLFFGATTTGPFNIFSLSRLMGGLNCFCSESVDITGITVFAFEGAFFHYESVSLTKSAFEGVCLRTFR